MIIIPKETGGDLRAPLCGHNVRALSIISPTSEDDRGRVGSGKSPFSNLPVFFVELEGGRPIKPEKEGKGRKSEKRNFQPEWFFQTKSKGPKYNGLLFFPLFAVYACVCERTRGVG